MAKAKKIKAVDPKEVTKAIAKREAEVAAYYRPGDDGVSQRLVDHVAEQVLVESINQEEGAWFSWVEPFEKSEAFAAMAGTAAHCLAHGCFDVPTTIERAMLCGIEIGYRLRAQSLMAMENRQK
jgi:hypothetical protein